MPNTIVRTIPTGLETHLQDCTTTLALLVKVIRTDGTVLGFTTTDTNIVYGGVTYERLSAIKATTIRQQINTDVDDLEIWGLLQSNRIASKDLRAGRYDGAVITIMLCNFNDIGAGVTTLFKGNIADVTLEDGKYTAEVRSLIQRLSQTIVEVTSKTCRVQKLGDARCGVDLASFQFLRAVETVGSSRVLIFSADTHPTDYFTHGTVKFTEGENINVVREVQQHVNDGSTAVIYLQEGFPYTVLPTEIAQLEAGCDRRRETCVAKFDNVVNFRGEPYIPVTDIILQRGRGAS